MTQPAWCLQARAPSATPLEILSSSWAEPAQLRRVGKGASSRRAHAVRTSGPTLHRWVRPRERAATAARDGAKARLCPPYAAAKQSNGDSVGTRRCAALCPPYGGFCTIAVLHRLTCSHGETWHSGYHAGSTVIREQTGNRR